MIRQGIFFIMMTIMVAALIIGCLSSCYNQKKATVQHGRAVTTYPEIGAKYCDDKFPITFVKGDSVITFDTLYIGGELFEDTLLIRDTVRITKTIQLPAKIVTKTITKVDTVINLAALNICETQRGKVIDLLNDKTAEAKKWEGKAKTRFYIMLALILLLIGGAAATIYLKTKKVKL